ncbi:MAG: NAD(P)-binding domain-containing protein [Planctomycetota bacterium]
MTWTLLIGLVGISAFLVATLLQRRAELSRMQEAIRTRDESERLGANEAQLQQPVIDLSRCLGCATCVAVCPEDGVLDLVHGQAEVVNGARCVGVAACERECPVGAITVTLANLDTRDDVPVLEETLEATGSPGLYLAGEVTAQALIKTAVEHGTAVAQDVAAQLEEHPGDDDAHTLDLLIVGAGPAGLACALEAKRLGLRAMTIEQEERLGGTVAKYPRRKLVMTLPVDLPMHGRLASRSYTKEELIDLWEDVAADHQLAIRHGEVFEGLERDPVSGRYTVHTKARRYQARNVCMAIGRRGVPRRLGIPGEDLPKVTYSLVDAASYEDRDLLVVGGGDAAVETALALAEQPGNHVTLSYRKDGFFRIRKKNEDRLLEAIEDQRIEVLYRSQLIRVQAEEVELSVEDDDGTISLLALENDDVFVMAGGVPPFEVLGKAGVSFDPSLRPPSRTKAPAERGTNLLSAVVGSLVATSAALIWAIAFSSYYLLPLDERPAHRLHDLLRPGAGLGLVFGILSVLLILVNLAYVLRRNPKINFRWGSLQKWMTSHVVTGVLALVTALLHGAMVPRDTNGGHAFYGLLILAVTGVIGRYVYAYVPRAANGRELELDEVQSELERIGEDWDHQSPRLSRFARERIRARIEKDRWGATILGRLFALARAPFEQRALLRDLSRAAEAEGLDEPSRLALLSLARRAHKTATATAHFEDLRSLLSTWRYLHRWGAALMVLLVIIHIVNALAFGGYFQSGSIPGGPR